jgi:hypothetical protein
MEDKHKMSNIETTSPKQDAQEIKQEEAFVEEMLRGFLQALLVEDSQKQRSAAADVEKS